MHVLLAGATGVIGRRIVPLLLADAHRVTGLTRSRHRAGARGADNRRARRLGWTPAWRDGFGALSTSLVREGRDR
jgi:nucleoside-diphosphate-sugar epimerase